MTALGTPRHMIIHSRNRSANTTSTDLANTTAALALCVFFFLGLAVLTRSLPTALAGTAGLAGALLLTFKMLALPTDYR